MKCDKIIIGNGIDAMIFNLFNPDYRIIIHDDLKDEFDPIPKEHADLILNSVIKLFHNDWNKILLDKLDLLADKKQLNINKTKDRKQLLAKKILNQQTGESLNLPAIYETDRKIKISDTVQEFTNFFDIPISVVKIALQLATQKNIIDITHLGQVRHITDNFISCEMGNIEFKKAMNTVRFNKFNSFLSPANFPKKTHPTSLFLFKYKEKAAGNSITYITKADNPCNRVNSDHTHFVVDVTGEYPEEKIIELYEPIGVFINKMVISEGKITSNFYHYNIPHSIEPLGRMASGNPDHRIEHTVERALRPELGLFYDLWQEQIKRNRSYQDPPNSIGAKKEQTKDFLLKLIHQATCLLDTVNWKENKPNKEIEYEKIVEEWVDMFRYWLSIGQVWEIRPEDFLKINERKA